MPEYNRNELCWCGSGLKYKKCHEATDGRIDRLRKKGALVPSRKILKNPLQIAGIREAGLRNNEILDVVAERIALGMTTEEINRIVHEQTLKLGAIPAPLNYQGFPKSVCVSVNNQVCHGIPSEEDLLEDGDIVNVDVTTIYNGYYADASRMFLIGDVDPDWQKLVRVTRECVELGVGQVKPWGNLSDIARVVSRHAHENGYSVVREIGGHGVGLEFHEDPWVGFAEPENRGMVLVPGMVFTIEPMINMGEPDVFCDSDNGWTIYTEDESPSAQWEVTVAVTEDGYEILAH